MPDIKKIVLTGGPCAGKTTALVKITEYFSGVSVSETLGVENSVLR